MNITSHVGDSLNTVIAMKGRKPCVGASLPDVPRRRDGVSADRTFNGVRRGGPMWPPVGSHLPQRSAICSAGIIDSGRRERILSVPKRRDGVPTDRTFNGVRRGGPMWPPAGGHLPQRSSLPSGGPFFLLAQKEGGERGLRGRRLDIAPAMTCTLPRSPTRATACSCIAG